MSKSLGNVIAPQEIIKRHGAEILRLWTAAEDYREDVRISEEILNRLVEAYRKLRNTARFLISNLYDFDPDKDNVPVADLPELDRWILHRTQALVGRCREAYEQFEFHTVYHALNNFCSVDLSALYLDIVKDRLYCEAANSRERRAAQTALYQILDCLVHLMAPVLSFTAEEIWEHMPKRQGAAASIFLSTIPLPEAGWKDEALAERWERILKIRGEILKGLEAARNKGLIGHSLDAKVVLYPDSYDSDGAVGDLMKTCKENWADIVIASQVDLPGGALPEELGEARQALQSKLFGAAGPIADSGWSYTSDLLQGAIAVYKAEGAKCERCWKYREEVTPDSNPPMLCGRCSQVLKGAVV